MQKIAETCAKLQKRKTTQLNDDLVITNYEVWMDLEAPTFKQLAYNGTSGSNPDAKTSVALPKKYQKLQR